MSLQPGTKIGSYEILASISSDQHGEVYKAADTQQRTVAIKVLSSQFSEDAGHRQRFDREAQMIASLKHPHICLLYDVGHENGMDYVVMEYLQGETLAEQLKRGPLPLEKALKISIAMADALDKAHRQGVTHRCLQPSTVMITPEGVKLLDFGLARLTHSPEWPVSASTVPTSIGSIPGAIAGATAYTAPEQYEGKNTDARTDIFAFGAILYEMLTGKKAFDGKTPMMLAAAVLSADPEAPSKLQTAVPPQLDYIVTRCLAKNPRQRMQTAWDVMGQLRWIVERGTESAPVLKQEQKREKLVWACAALAVLLAILLLLPAYRYFNVSAEPHEVHFLISNIGLTPGPGGATPPIVSPNGRWIASSRGTTRGLDAISLGSVTMQILLPDQAIGSAFWSPDSRSIAFFEDGMLKKAEVAGGPSQNICEAAPPIGFGTWSSQGIILFSSGGVIYRVLAAGGQPVAITSLDQSQQETEHLAPYFLPDGHHYLYLAVSSQPAASAIYVGLLDSKERTRLFASDSRAIYVAPGYVLFNRGTTVYAQPFDTGRLALMGEPIRVADGVPPTLLQTGVMSATLTRSASFGASQTGVMSYRTGADPSIPSAGNAGGVPDRALIWFDRSGVRSGQVGTAAGYGGVDLSPDGKRLAVHRHENAGGDNWILESTTGTIQPQRLTFDAAQDNSMPIWSPDGKEIAFGSRRNGKWGLYVKPADGATSEQLLFESDLPKMPMSWSPDGKSLVFWSEDPKTRGDVWMIPLTGDKKPVAILQAPANERNPQVSPDGKWIAYSSSQSGRGEIYIKPFPNGPGQWQVSTEGGSVPRWRRDSKELYFVGPSGSIMASEIRTSGSSVQPGVPRTLFTIPNNPGIPHPTDYLVYAVSADGQRFLIPQPVGVGGGGGSLADTIASVTDQGGFSAGTNSITVVLNWPSMLKRK